MALLAVTVIVGLATRGGWPESVRTALAAVGLLLIALGAVAAVLAVSGLGSALSALPAPLPDQQLRSSGIYAVVRHPIYGSLIALTLGAALLTGPWTLLPATALAVVLDLKRRVEEDFLSATYPGYAEYRSRVRWALAPYLR